MLAEQIVVLSIVLIISSIISYRKRRKSVVIFTAGIGIITVISLIGMLAVWQSDRDRIHIEPLRIREVYRTNFIEGEPYPIAEVSFSSVNMEETVKEAELIIHGSVINLEEIVQVDSEDNSIDMRCFNILVEDVYHSIEEIEEESLQLLFSNLVIKSKNGYLDVVEGTEVVFALMKHDEYDAYMLVNMSSGFGRIVGDYIYTPHEREELDDWIKNIEMLVASN